MPLLSCPVCGHTGEVAGTEESFEVRGRYQLMQVRKCRSCGAGLFVRFRVLPTEAEPELIPEEAWREMEAVWARESEATGEAREPEPTGE